MKCLYYNNCVRRRVHCTVVGVLLKQPLFSVNGFYFQSESNEKALDFHTFSLVKYNTVAEK